MSIEPVFPDPDQTNTPKGSTSYVIGTEAQNQAELECAADAVLAALQFFAPHLHVGAVGSTMSGMTLGVTCDTPPHLRDGAVWRVTHADGEIFRTSDRTFARRLAEAGGEGSTCEVEALTAGQEGGPR